MTGIIVVFPNKDNATNIRNLLARGGMDVIGVCSTGAQAMHYADTVDNGIVVCGYRMKDMMYTQLREYLPDSFEMLLIASQERGCRRNCRAFYPNQGIRPYEYHEHDASVHGQKTKKTKERIKES